MTRPDWLPAAAGFRSAIPRASASTELLEDALDAALAGFDMVVAHDLVVLESHRSYHEALSRWAARHPRVKWLHFLHAAPPRVGAMKAPGFESARYVCLAASLRDRTAEALGVPVGRMHVQPNALPVERTLGLSRKLQSAFDVPALLQADVAMLHPFSLARLANKQPQQVLFVAARLKQLDRRVQVLFTDFCYQKASAKSLHAKLGLKWLAARLGLTGADLQFASDRGLCGPLSQDDVNALFRLTNVFVHPSSAEAGPLSILEAAANSVLCVVNSEVPAFQDLLGDATIAFAFSAPEQTEGPGAWEAQLGHFENREAAYSNLAKSILAELDGSTAQRAKRRYFREFCSETRTGAFAELCEEVMRHD